VSIRLKKALQNVIDCSQVTFLVEKGLLDNITVASEVVEELRCKRRKEVAVKIDFEKAYESVNWEFLFYMLGRLGFCHKSIS